MHFTSDKGMSAEEKLLYAKIDDMIEKARRGRVASSAFLTPGEVSRAEKYLLRGKFGLSYAFYGGYEDAERKMLAVFPDYIDAEYFDTDEIFRALLIKASGYAELDHRAYLGALMNLSLKRETLGDIVILPEGAVVFCTLPVASMLTDRPSPLERVGRDKVLVSYADKDICVGFAREYETLSVIMSSLRLDCAVAALSNLSRSAAQEKIARGDVQLSYVQEFSASAEIAPDDTLSIRGVGKFIINSVCGETRSGRLKVELRRYV